MREFFRGWRRKVGCITLVIACALMAAWARSLYPDLPSSVPSHVVFDEHSWQFGYRLTRVDHAVHRLSVEHSYMIWDRIQADAPIQVANVIAVWLNATDANFPDVAIQSTAWISHEA